ncbi:hypothetical protein G7K_3631-t1 [Saitoella complicata NRRL Y-17804]|uniref:Major facilitator superfamily (MFS) profile domain-containing protein n=1 Tax=Saitoella complicata (strain BCRC 22490 / CBS 7301 / JCM 7358 / NBRC 10748 / NRRL Y-17804) TaxID=698492 RepID=A0A0E9NII2_SAICN|nr:hypothetical protein G7K_3631-t1 [Saitoella complicata NRRL Y-17804]
MGLPLAASVVLIVVGACLILTAPYIAALVYRHLRRCKEPSPQDTETPSLQGAPISKTWMNRWNAFLETHSKDLETHSSQADLEASLEPALVSMNTPLAEKVQEQGPALTLTDVELRERLAEKFAARAFRPPRNNRGDNVAYRQSVSSINAFAGRVGEDGLKELQQAYEEATAFQLPQASPPHSVSTHNTYNSYFANYDQRPDNRRALYMGYVSPDAYERAMMEKKSIRAALVARQSEAAFKEAFETPKKKPVGPRRPPASPVSPRRRPVPCSPVGTSAAEMQTAHIEQTIIRAPPSTPRISRDENVHPEPGNWDEFSFTVKPEVLSREPPTLSKQPSSKDLMSLILTAKASSGRRTFTKERGSMREIDMNVDVKPSHDNVLNGGTSLKMDYIQMPRPCVTRSVSSVKYKIGYRYPFAKMCHDMSVRLVSPQSDHGLSDVDWERSPESPSSIIMTTNHSRGISSASAGSVELEEVITSPNSKRAYTVKHGVRELPTIEVNYAPMTPGGSLPVTPHHEREDPFATPNTDRQNPFSATATPGVSRPGSPFLQPTAQSLTNPPINKWRFIASFTEFMTLGLHDGAIGALLLYLESYYHIGYVLVSVIFLSNAFGYIIGVVAGPYIFNRFGRFYTIGAGVGLQFLTYALICWRPPYPLFIIAFCFAGIGFALMLAQVNVFHAALQNSTTLLGYLHGGYGLGATIAPLIATQMVTRGVPWNYYFYIMVGVTAMSMVFILWAFKPRPEDAAYELAQRRGSLMGSNEEAKPQGLKTALKNRTTVITAIFLCFYQGAEVCLGGFLVAFLVQARNGDPTAAGWVATGFWGGIVAGRFLLGHASARWGERLCIFVYIGASMAMHLIFWLVPQFTVEAVAVSLVGFALGPIYPTTVSWFTKVVNRKLHVVCMSFMSAVGSSGGAIFPFVVGLGAQVKGPSVVSPVVISLLSLMTVFWFVQPKVQRHADRATRKGGGFGGVVEVVAVAIAVAVAVAIAFPGSRQWRPAASSHARATHKGLPSVNSIPYTNKSRRPPLKAAGRLAPILQSSIHPLSSVIQPRPVEITRLSLCSQRRTITSRKRIVADRALPRPNIRFSSHSEEAFKSGTIPRDYEHT